MSVDFADVYHAATDVKVDWPDEVQEWAERKPANAALLMHIRALIPGHPANAQTVAALVTEVLAEMERASGPPVHEVRAKGLSGKPLPEEPMVAQPDLHADPLKGKVR